MQLITRTRTTLLVCLVLLGLQLLFPPDTHAAEQRVICEELVLPSDTEEEGAAPELELGLLPRVLGVERYCASVGRIAVASLRDANADRAGLWLLAVAGFQPAAP